MDETPAKPRRRWFRFTLRGALLGTALVAVVVAVQVHAARQRRARREGRLSPLPKSANQILGALVRNPTLALFFLEAITKTRLRSERMTTL
jgi:integral membrane sensor domain MASE1